MNTIKQQLAALDAAAVTLTIGDCVDRWVRITQAIRICGWSFSAVRRPPGGASITSLRRKVKPRFPTLSGVERYWLLDDVKRTLREKGRSRCKWNAAEIEQLTSLLARHEMGVIARMLARPLKGLKEKVYALGLTNLMRKCGLLGCADLRCLLRRRSHATFNHWRRNGLKALNLHGYWWYSLRDVRDFLSRRESMLVYLSPDVRRLLRLSQADIEQARKEAA